MGSFIHGWGRGWYRYFPPVRQRLLEVHVPAPEMKNYSPFRVLVLRSCQVKFYKIVIKRICCVNLLTFFFFLNNLETVIFLFKSILSKGCTISQFLLRTFHFINLLNLISFSCSQQCLIKGGIISQIYLVTHKNTKPCEVDN